jgi:hypothetical protein
MNMFTAFKPGSKGLQRKIIRRFARFSGRINKCFEATTAGLHTSHQVEVFFPFAAEEEETG